MNTRHHAKRFVTEDLLGSYEKSPQNFSPARSHTCVNLDPHHIATSLSVLKTIEVGPVIRQTWAEGKRPRGREA